MAQITFGVNYKKGTYPIVGVDIVFTLLNYAGIPISPFTQLTATSDINGHAKVIFTSIKSGDYKIKAEIPVDSGCGIKSIISNKITIASISPNNNCYRWDIYSYLGDLLKSGTSQPDPSNPLITIIDYSGIAPGQYKVRLWDCNKSCTSNLKSFTIIDNSLPTGIDPSGWNEVQLS